MSGVEAVWVPMGEATPQRPGPGAAGAEGPRPHPHPGIWGGVAAVLAACPGEDVGTRLWDEGGGRAGRVWGTELGIQGTTPSPAARGSWDPAGQRPHTPWWWPGAWCGGRGGGLMGTAGSSQVQEEIWGRRGMRGAEIGQEMATLKFKLN